MIIINIIGGLGNQMFQYAFGYAISKRLKQELKFDISGFANYPLRTYELELFNLDVTFASNEEIKNLKYQQENIFLLLTKKFLRKPRQVSSNYYKEKTFAYDESVCNVQGDIYFDGYWQSQKYFEDHRAQLLEFFTLKNPLHEITKKYELKINNSDSVSLHVRRGDYVTDSKTNSVHGTCNLTFYKDSILKMKSLINDPKFFIFSDDLSWVKENFEFLAEKELVEFPKEIPDHEEMYLMSQCKHNIIANSSFSWWGAWLNQNPNKIVIAPKKWFTDQTINTTDLIPTTWIRL